MTRSSILDPRLTGTSLADHLSQSRITRENKRQNYTPHLGEGLLGWIERSAGIIALIVLFGSVSFSVRAQPVAGTARANNIITERLKGKDLRRWNAIERIVFAEDIDGRPLHPTLRGLWERLERSNHTVYIEMPNRGSAVSNTAGVFLIEKFDPEGLKHVAVIRLYPETIDQAYVGRAYDWTAAGAEEGFIPFQGLSREERYAEVLGHEMAHAVDILSDPTRARMVVEIVQRTNELFLSRGRLHGYAKIEAEMQDLIDRRDAFLKELEPPAERAEMSVWREISSSRQARNKGQKMFSPLQSQHQ